MRFFIAPFPHCLIASFLVLSGCVGREAAGIHISLDPARDDSPAVVRVTGLPVDDLEPLAAMTPDDERWRDVLKIAVASDDPAQPGVAGRYRVAGRAIIFTPLFPFDAGRQYSVVLDPARLRTPRATGPVTATVALPAVVRTPTTRVARLLPSGDTVPENLLRMYIEFTAPMGRGSARDYVRLLDEHGRDVPDALLAIDVELWNPAYTRCTLFFDPGRVKRGILPNEQMGRALQAGRRYTIVVDARWPDANGQPLAEPFRRSFSVAPADLSPLRLADWRVTAPPAGSRDPLVVAFPAPLDYALVERALGVADDSGESVRGETVVGPQETSWRFTPAEPWRAGGYDVIALGVLESPAGNRIDRPFDLDPRERADADAGASARHRVPFVVR
jgi:hypothetical protein